jgi:hypothetical protein
LREPCVEPLDQFLGALQGGAVLDDPDNKRAGGLGDIATIGAGPAKDAAHVDRATAPRVCMAPMQQRACAVL